MEHCEHFGKIDSQAMAAAKQAGVYGAVIFRHTPVC